MPSFSLSFQIGLSNLPVLSEASASSNFAETLPRMIDEWLCFCETDPLGLDIERFFRGLMFDGLRSRRSPVLLSRGLELSRPVLRLQGSLASFFLVTLLQERTCFDFLRCPSPNCGLFLACFLASFGVSTHELGREFSSYYEAAALRLSWSLDLIVSKNSDCVSGPRVWE